jgi:hypothetical protein
MNTQDEAIGADRELCANEVRRGCGYTVPWLELDASLFGEYARGELAFLPEPWTWLYPADAFADVEGRDVLCLASGGDQQSTVFGVLGARVTVVNFVEGQLEGDRRAAAHYGYEVTTHCADMRNLSCLADASFDLVF